MALNERISTEEVVQNRSRPTYLKNDGTTGRRPGSGRPKSVRTERLTTYRCRAGLDLQSLRRKVHFD